MVVVVVVVVVVFVHHLPKELLLRHLSSGIDFWLYKPLVSRTVILYTYTYLMSATLDVKMRYSRKIAGSKRRHGSNIV